MTKKRTTDILTMGFASVCLAVLFIGVGAIPSQTPLAGGGAALLQYHSSVCVKANIDGQEVDRGCQPNVLTNGGKNLIKAALRNGTINAVAINVSALALGNGAIPAATAVNVTGREVANGLALSPATYAVGTSNGNWSWAKTWTSTADSRTINQTGLYQYSPTTAQALVAATSFAPTTLQTGDQITVTYRIWVT